MSDANTYAADPARIAAAARVTDQIADMAKSMMASFVDEVGRTDGWEGKDSYGRSIAPQLESEFSTTKGTGEALAQAIVAVADGSITNAKNILSTQDGNLEAIQQAAQGGTSIDGTNRKH